MEKKEGKAALHNPTCYLVSQAEARTQTQYPPGSVHLISLVTPWLSDVTVAALAVVLMGKHKGRIEPSSSTPNQKAASGSSVEEVS